MPVNLLAASIIVSPPQIIKLLKRSLGSNLSLDAEPRDIRTIRSFYELDLTRVARDDVSHAGDIV